MEEQPSSSDPASPNLPGGEKCRLVVVGATVNALVTGADGFGNYAHIVRRYSDLDDWKAQADDVKADLIIVHCPAFFPETVEWISERVGIAGAARAVVVYEFAKEAAARSVERAGSGITALRAPVRASALREACEADIALAALRSEWAESPIEPDFSAVPETGPSEGIPPRQFSDEQLSRLAQISTAVDCECPHHLSALLVSLNAFEEYSRKCENRSEEDAVLHAYLHRSTARARSIVEDALSVLAETEGFDLS